MTYQLITIVGNVGRDPEFKYTPQGIAVCDFSVAVNKRTGKGEDRKEKTTWFRVTAWRERAEFASKYIKKGGRLLVVGEVEAHAYTDKDGQAQATLELTAANIQLLDSKSNGEGAAAGADDAGDDTSDIPF